MDSSATNVEETPQYATIVVELREARQVDFGMSSIHGQLIQETRDGITIQVPWNGNETRHYFVPWHNILYIQLLPVEGEDEDESTTNN